MQGTRVPPSQQVPLPSRKGRAVVAEAQPRPVVRREDDQRALVEAEALQGGEHFAHRPVDFLDHVAVEAQGRMAAEFVAHVQRHVRHAVGEIEEEGPRGAALDELYSPLGVPRGELLLILVRETDLHAPLAIQ